MPEAVTSAGTYSGCAVRLLSDDGRLAPVLSARVIRSTCSDATLLEEVM